MHRVILGGSTLATPPPLSSDFPPRFADMINLRRIVLAAIPASDVTTATRDVGPKHPTRAKLEAFYCAISCDFHSPPSITTCAKHVSAGQRLAPYMPTNGHPRGESSRPTGQPIRDTPPDLRTTLVEALTYAFSARPARRTRCRRGRRSGARAGLPTRSGARAHPGPRSRPRPHRHRRRTPAGGRDGSGSWPPAWGPSPAPAPAPARGRTGAGDRAPHCPRPAPSWSATARRPGPGRGRQNSQPQRRELPGLDV